MNEEYYPAADHQLKIHADTGASYWAVKSKNLMFTRFEVSPHRVFGTHSHESEQMTYVLEGKLFFNVGGKVYCLGPGDLITIPSFKEHAVWTESEGAKAVDAWSPANPDY
jgi:quercetin dioxygenase-like cupin family protein